MTQDEVEHKSERVVCLLTVSEFVAFSHLCERLGLSQSATLRMWVREAIERHGAREGGQTPVLKLHSTDTDAA